MMSMQLFCTAHYIESHAASCMRRHLHMQTGAAGWPHLSPAAQDEAAAAAREASQLAEKAAELAAAQVRIVI